MQVKAERELYEVNKAKVESLADNAELENVLALLNVAARQAEEESEKLAEEFIAKRITMQQYLDQFVEQRKLAYLRKIKADKLQELLLKPQQANATARLPLSTSSMAAYF